MKIHFLGTGAAEGVPALFCNCEFCKGARRRGEVRSRAQVVLDDLSIDFPPDSFYHAARFGVDFSALKYVLVTHSHMDHFFAGDFVLRGYKYAQNMTSPELQIFANAETLEIFREVTRRELKPEIAEHIALHEIRPFEKVTFGGWTVYPLKAKHSSREPLLFLLEKEGRRILHLHDSGPIPEANYDFLAKLGGKTVDLITFDCTFLWDRTNENGRHMGLHENAEIFDRLKQIGLADGNTKKIITHFSHNAMPTAERLKKAEEEFGVIAAYDGMEINI